jgi:MurNAc alpha-1-phosphate uridylyltransferase
MVLAAGMGKRMLGLTEQLPKPLVPLAGRPLIDRVLDRIADAGIARAVVNVHYRAEQLVTHLALRSRPLIVVSQESELLDTGGGVAHALPHLGTHPFLIHNSDSVWIDQDNANLARLAAAWDVARMDCLLLLAPIEASLGYAGTGDFSMAADGRLRRRSAGERVPFVFAGASIAHPRLFEDCPPGPFSLNKLWDRAMSVSRLHGLTLQGTWMHVGDPAALEAAEALLRRDATA